MYLKKIYTFNSSQNCFAARRCFTWFTYAHKLVNVLLFAVFLLLSIFVSAQNPISGNQGFQILTEGNFTSTGGHHIHGPLAVGGNFIINSSAGEINMDATGSYVFPGDGSTTTGLLVKGSITWTNSYVRVLNGKYIHIGSSTGSTSGDNGVNQGTQVYPTGTSYNNAKRIEGTIDQTPSPAVFQTVGFDYTTLFTNYRATSTTLSGKTNNVQLYNSSNVAISGNNVTSSQSVRVNSLITGVNYLNLTASSLTNISEIVFNDQPSISKVLIINVPVSANYTWNNVNMAGLSGSLNGSYVLWNFYGSTTYNLTINQAALIVGTVYAPNMNLIKLGTGDIDGNLIAKTAQLGIGEIHNYQFASDLSSCTTPNLTATTSPACLGGIIHLNAESTTSGVTFSWTGPNGYTSTEQYPCITPAQLTNSGNYTVTATKNGCNNSVTLNVVVNNQVPPSPPTVANVYKCAAGTATFTATGCTGTVNWYDMYWNYLGSGTSYTTSSLSQNTQYLVECQGSVCTSDKADVYVIFQSTPSTTITGTTSICSGESTTLTASCDGLQAPNLLVNEGFELSSDAPWWYESGAGVVTSNFRSGAKAAKLTGNSLGMGVSISNLKPNTTYTATCYLKGSTTGQGVDFYATDFGGANVVSGTTLTTSYVLKTITFTTGATNTYVSLGLWKWGGTATIYADDFTLTETSPNCSFSWSPGGATTQSITVSPTSNTTYTVTTGFNGCNVTASSTVAVSGTAISVNSANICSGQSATLTATGCTGTVSWSNGVTANAITVSPTVTTNYTASCTPTSSNLLSNPNFEAGSTLTSWANWGNTTITSVSSERQNGTYGAKTNATSTAGGFGQDIAAVAGEGFTLNAYGKVSNATPWSAVGFKFLNSSMTQIGGYYENEVNATSFQQYTVSATAPAGTAWVEVYGWSNAGAILYLDNFTLTKASCTTSAISTVTVSSGNVTPTATVVSTGCTGSTGSISMTNLPDGYSTNINGGAWNQSKNSYTDLAAGTYSIGYQGGGCSSYANFTVSTSTDNPILSLSKTDPTCSTTGTITVTGNGGTTGLGSATYQLWQGISGTLVSNLTSNTNYPNSPSSSTTLGILEGYTNAYDSFGGRISGYIVPPTTGTYYFWIASDDDGEFWLSTNTNPTNKSLIANLSGWANPRQWNKFTSQKSAAISLVAGQIYYFEALYKEGGGGDNISIGWSKPGEASTLPSEVIPGKYIRPNITNSTTTPVYQYKINSGAFQTSNVFTGLGSGTYTVTIMDAGGCTTTSSITLTSSGSVAAPTATGASRCGTGTVTLSASGCSGTYNWYAAAAGGTSLGTGASFTTPSISSTTTYYVDCTVSSCTSSRASATATIVSGTGTTPIATVINTGCTGSTGSITVTNLPDGYYTNINGGSFTQYKNSYTDLAAGTYSIGYQGGTCNTYASFTVNTSTDNPLLSITKTDPTCTTSGSVTVSGSGGTTGLGTISYQLWYGISGNSVSNLTSNANYPNSPSFSTTLGIAEGYENSIDNFGGKISGYLIPPTTGTYYIWIASDDNSEFWGSSDANPANKVLLASVSGYTGFREWNKFTSQKTVALSLVAGQIYYFEALYKEGTGGDNISIGWSKPGEATTVPSEVIPGKYLRPNIASSTTTPVYQYKINSGAFQTSNVFTGLAAGAYTITIQDAGGCTATSNITLTSSGSLAPPTTTGASRCGTGTVTLSANGCTGTYNWYAAAAGGASLGTGASYTTPSISATKTYYVDCTVNSCTSTRATAVATINSGITATVSSNSPVCIGSTINLSASGGTSYSWSGPSSFTSNAQNPSLTATAAKGGVYTVTVTGAGGCSTTATTNVVLQNVVISNVAVSACINHPLQDVATVNVTIAWSNAPSGDKIKVIINDKIEYIDVAGGATSPQTVTFVVPANGITNNSISAGWVNLQSGNCLTTATYNAPAACSSDNLSCEKILYLCGPDKPSDGDAWDHGFMNYLTAVGAVGGTATYTKPDASGYGLYNPSSINTPVTVNLNDYTLVIISPTTENNIAPNLLTALKGYAGGILMMNYAQAADLGLTVGNAYYNFQSTAYTNNTNQINVYNYDNISPSYDMVLTGANYQTSADGSLWFGLNNASTTNNGVNFNYTASDVLTGVPATHGARVYLGFHMNGLYANAQNGGAMPAPITSYFTPSKHLTLEAKVLFDQALKNATNGIVVSATGDTECAGGTINLTSTGVGINTYAWTGPSGFNSTLQNPTIANATSAMGGIYTLTVMSSTGCTATATANVVITTINPPTSSGASRCNAGTLALSATGCIGTYKWYNVASGGTVLSSSATYTTPSISTTTNYYVSCTVGSCVSTRATVTATINTPPTATASSNSPVTIGGTLNLFATGGDTYAWTGPNGFASTEQNSSNSGVTSLNAGIYTVTVTTNGCSATATTEVVMSNYDPGDIDCSLIPALNFVNPTLISGTALANGAKYRFSNVTSGTDAILTIVSRTHSDIVIFDLDLPASSYGGYDAAFQPMIDYNWINGGGSFDAPGEKSVTFKFDFVDAGTTNPKVLPNLLATGIDIDGSGNEVREFIQASGYQSYQTQSPSSLTLSGALKAKGPLTNYAGINELALDAMISFGYINTSSITITYGGDWNGSKSDFADNGPGNSDENRLNSLYFKCYNFNTTVCALPLAAPSATGNTRCGNGTTTLSASGCTGTYYWYTGSTGGVAVGIGSPFTTPSISNTTTYYVECNAVGCTSSRTSATATVIPNPVVTITGDVECVGSTIALSATGGGTYAWTGPNSFASTLQNPTRPNATTAMAGVYTLTVTANGCSTVATTNVTVSNNPTPTITGTTTICNGQATTLTAAGGNYYVWSDGSTSAAVTVSPTSNTTYTATVYQNSVTSTNLITNVTNFNASNFNYINSVNSYADASSLFDNIDNTGGATFHASRVTSGLDWGISYNLGGSFLINNLSIDRRNDCCTDRGEGGVMQVWRNGAMVYQSNILSGTGDIVLAATPAPNVVGDEVRYVFLAGANSLTGEGLLNFSEWIIGGTKLCSATATKNIVVNAIPSAPTSAGNSRCGTGTVALSASGCTGGTISWYSTLTGGSALTTGANYTTPNLSSTTTYYIECSQNSCVSTTRNSAVATVNTVPTPTANSTGACVGGTIALSAIGGSTYSWTGPSSFSSLTQNPSRSGATVAMTGYYVVTVTSSGGCTATANTYVQVSTISASVSNITCNNNGTLATSTDDYFTFLLTPSGNLGGRFTISASQGINPIAVTLSDGNATGSLSYAYPIPLRVPNGKAGGGNVTLTLTDVQNPSCSFNVIVADPGTCNAANCTGTTQTVSYTYRIPLGSTELTQVPINLPKFDNTGGTKILTKVDLKYGMNEVTTGYIENQAASSSTIDIALSGSESIQLGATTLKSIPINFTTSTTLPAQIIVPAQGNYIGDSAYVVFGNTKYSTLYRMNNWLSKVIDDIYITPQTDARWVTNATGNATHDDDIYIIPLQTFSFYDSTTFTTPTDLTQFIGAGNIGLTASTDNNLNLTGGGGNNVFFQRTKAYAYATITYSYVCCIPPTATSASSNSAICSGQSINLIASSTGGTAYSWSGPNGFTSTLQNPTISGATTTASGIYTVTIVGVGTCTATATTNVVVNAIPASPTSAGNARCGTGTVTLSASGCAGGTISWYSTLTGGSALTTGANYTTPSLTSTTTFYIECSQNSCVSTTRNSAVATINTIPIASATGDTECVGGIINLGSSGGNTYSWTGPSSFSSTLQNPTISNGQTVNTGIYTVAVTSSAGCSATATANVVVNVIPASPTSAGNSRCGTGTVSLSASGCAGGTISWYSTLTGGSALTTGANYTTPSLTSTTTFYIECSQNSCVSTTRNSAVATINTIPIASATGDTECVGGIINLGSSGGNTYSWTGPSSFSSTLQNPTISNGQTTNSGIYTVTVTSSAGCSATATANVIVNVIPASPTSAGNSRCGIGTVSLSASGCAGGTISWYSTLTGGSALTTGANYTTPSLSSTTTYYIECAQNSCVSTTRNSAVATVNTIPTASATSNTPIVGGTLNLYATGGNTYSWIGPNGFTSTLKDVSLSPVTANMANVYTVTVNVNGCTATATTEVVLMTNDPGGIDCSLIPTLSFTNPTLISGTAGANNAQYRFSNVTGGIDAIVTIVSRTHADITIVDLDIPAASYGGYDAAMQPIIDYNWINGDGTFDAAGERSVTFKIDFVTTGTTTPQTIPTFIASGIDIDGSGDEVREFIQSSGYQSHQVQTPTSLTLSGALKAKGSYANYAGINELALDAVISYGYVNTSSITITYGAEWNGNTANFGDNINPTLSDERRLNSLYFKCENLNTTVCDVALAAPTGIPASRCGTGTVTLSANGCYGTYNWYNSATGGTSIGSSNTFITSSITSTTTYYVECNAVGCTSNRASVVATVNAIPAAPTVSSNSICGPGSVTLSASNCTGGTLTWFNSQTGGTSIGTGASFTANALTSSAVYFASCTSANNCVSASRNYGTATINPIPVATLTAINSLCIGFQASNNGKLLLSKFEASGSFSYNVGATYNSGTASAFAAIPTNGELLTSIADPSPSISYTVRIKNNTNCTIDRTVTFNNQCSPCPIGYCEPAMILKTK